MAKKMLMQVACPKCNSRFAVADHLLSPSGRKLKCVACGGVWHAMLEGSVQGPEGTTARVETSASAPRPAAPGVGEEKVFPRNASVAPVAQNHPQEIIPAFPVKKEGKEARFDEMLQETDPVVLVQTMRGAFAAGQHSNAGENDGESGRAESSRDEIPLESEGFSPSPSLADEFSADLSTIDIRAPGFSPTDLPTGARKPLFNREDEATNPTDLSGPADAGIDLDALVTDDDPGSIPSVFASGFDRGENEERKHPSHFLIGLVVGLAMFVAGGGGLWYGREQIFAMWPALRGHLADLGLPVVDLAGSLRFSEVTTLMTTEEGVRVFMVRGVMENVASVSVRLPSLRLIFRDEKRHVMRRGEAVDPPVSALSPGEKVGFVLRLQNPPASATVDIGLERT